MLYRRVPTWVAIVVIGLAAVFVAGFFRPGGPTEAATPAQALVCREAPAAEPVNERALDTVVFNSISVPANLYRRAADFSCKVESVIDTYTAVDKDIAEFGGEITQMEITGNDNGRRGRISCTVSVDKFNPFVAYVRGRGKILSERITASSLSPSAGDRIGAHPGPRELSLVTLQIVDEKVAKEVEESRGLLAGSFTRSASHFLAGLAVIAEALGWVAPYLLILAALLVSIAAIRRLRRRDEAGLPLGAQQVR